MLSKRFLIKALSVFMNAVYHKCGILRFDKVIQARFLRSLTEAFLDEPLEGHLWIVEERQIRIRG